jgi:putative FmdB family regulatory protein
MPTYEYTCPDGHDFERFYRKISDAPADVVCPECGKPAVRKLSASGFAFKGSGFYLTDYGKNAHRGTGEPVGGGEKSEKNERSGGESGGESKADAKPSDAAPAAKAESKSAESATPPAKASEAKSSESKPSAPAPKPSGAPPKSDK